VFDVTSGTAGSAGSTTCQCTACSGQIALAAPPCSKRLLVPQVRVTTTSVPTVSRAANGPRPTNRNLASLGNGAEFVVGSSSFLGCPLWRPRAGCFNGSARFEHGW
jgi:hypothetical protein